MYKQQQSSQQVVDRENGFLYSSCSPLKKIGDLALTGADGFDPQRLAVVPAWAGIPGRPPIAERLAEPV